MGWGRREQGQARSQVRDGSYLPAPVPAPQKCALSARYADLHAQADGSADGGGVSSIWGGVARLGWVNRQRARPAAQGTSRGNKG